MAKDAPPAQPAREWVGVTDDDIVSIRTDCVSTPPELSDHPFGWAINFARAIESKLRENNVRLPVGCHRSHPHEDMDEVCELKTEIARLRNKLASNSKAGGDEPVANSHLAALMRYTDAFYSSAIEHGMRPGPVADCVAHVERSARALHAMATRPQPQAEETMEQMAARLASKGW